ncbi:MAG: hypothetical protein ABIO43_03460 [Sphingomicrobium sp.]
MVEHTGSSAQRIRIGLTGLAFAFLLVLLGSAITRSGQGQDGVSENTAALNAASSEPLAELGVAPGSGAHTNSSASNTADK